ncbi:hypothetical protein [Chryseobacterium sp. POE27]|uniref:hypothetical protein n=1 Tax=Chryseobacterium sp. POE27 TaxID=3138177 RepID=UPI00321B257D
MEIYSFPELIDNIDPAKEKPATSKNLTFKDIRDKVGNKNNLSLKKEFGLFTKTSGRHTWWQISSGNQ